MTVFSPVKKLPELPFFLGLVLAAVGAALVMIYKPKPEAPAPAPAATASITATDATTDSAE